RAEVRAPRARDPAEARALPAPQSERADRRMRRGLHRHELGRSGGAGAEEGSGREEGGYAHRRMVAVHAAPPPFVAHVERVTAADLPYSWHPGCPVAPSQLRRIRLSYIGFDGRRHLGELVVNARVVLQATTIFRT